jgi:hypothetical protein
MNFSVKGEVLKKQILKKETREKREVKSIKIYFSKSVKKEFKKKISKNSV